MPYILNKTNGAILTTIEDASLDITTNLTFVGRNYSGYGEAVNENFLKLLENFANTTEPSKPVMGQIWFDTGSQQLKVCSDGKTFKGLANIYVQSTRPDLPKRGDLWWDSTNKQLKSYDGATFLIIGPPTSAIAKGSWVSVEEINTANTGTNSLETLFEAKIGPTVVATIANLSGNDPNRSFTPNPLNSSLTINSGTWIVVKNGITLKGCDDFGSSKASGYYFWGTASDSLKSTTTTNVTTTFTSNNSTHYVPFVTTINGESAVLTTSTFHFNPSTNVLNVTATAARYADLAENYLADKIYSIGTVMAVGGTAEVTACQPGDRAIGVVSDKPAYLMNEGLAGGTAIALKGRVPVRIVGNVNKGDRLVAADNGRARSTPPGHPDVFAIALESSKPGVARIEALIL
jgi:hypothetical protein